jgi:hypothetical protein
MRILTHTRVAQLREKSVKKESQKGGEVQPLFGVYFTRPNISTLLILLSSKPSFRTQALCRKKNIFRSCCSINLDSLEADEL